MERGRGGGVVTVKRLFWSAEALQRLRALTFVKGKPREERQAARLAEGFVTLSSADALSVLHPL